MPPRTRRPHGDHPPVLHLRHHQPRAAVLPRPVEHQQALRQHQMLPAQAPWSPARVSAEGRPRRPPAAARRPAPTPPDSRRACRRRGPSPGAASLCSSARLDVVPGAYSATLDTDSAASPASAMKPGSRTPPAASMIGMFRRRTAASRAIRAASPRNVAVSKAWAPICLIGKDLVVDVRLSPASTRCRPPLRCRPSPDSSAGSRRSACRYSPSSCSRATFVTASGSCRASRTAT